MATGMVERRGKKKTWVSDGSKIDTPTGRKDVRLNKEHHRSPMRIALKQERARSRFLILSEAEWSKRAGLWPDATYAAYVARKEREKARLLG